MAKTLKGRTIFFIHEIQSGDAKERNINLREAGRLGYDCLLLLCALMEGVEQEKQLPLGGRQYLVRRLLHPVRLEIVPADN